MVKSLLSAQIPPELTQTPYCRGTGTRRTWLSNFPLTSAISSCRNSWIFLHFLGRPSDAVTLGETPQGHLQPGSSEPRLCRAPSFSKGVVCRDRCPLPQGPAEKGRTPSAHTSISWLQNTAAGGGTRGSTPWPSTMWEWAKEGQAVSKIPLLCLLTSRLPWTSTGASLTSRETTRTPHTSPPTLLLPASSCCKDQSW